MSSPLWYSDQQAKARQLIAGRRCEFVVALELLSRGCSVRLGDGELHDQLVDYAADFDLQANGVDVEVKGRTCRFTSVDDYPFDTIFVGKVATWREKHAAGRLPAYVVVVSEPTSGLIVVPTRTIGAWRREIGRDVTTSAPLPSLAAPKSCAISLDALVGELEGLF